MSSDLAVRVRELGKSYRLAHRSRETSLRAQIAKRVKRGFRSAERETFWALRDVSFEVRKGEAIGIIGHNGAGKSTLLKILSRIVSPTEGRVEMYGRFGSLLEVGTGFHRELTGRENIYLNGGILGMRRAEIDRHFDSIVEFAEVERFLDTPVKRYSSGMYVRLAFSVAAHFDRDILIVDEVLAVGDADFQRKCLDKMGDVARGGRTVLYVSHKMQSVAALCDRVLLVQDGHIVSDGDPERVIQEYLSTHVQGAIREDGLIRVPADETRRVQIRSIAAMDGQGRATGHFDIGEAMAVEIEVDVREAVSNLVLALQLRTLEDEVCFVTTEADLHNYETGDGKRVWPRRPGRYCALVELPTPFLNTGEYQLRVHAAQPGGPNHDVLRGPRIEVRDVSGSFASCLAHRRRPGHVALPLPWSVEHE